jgi:hypothetical protein
MFGRMSAMPIARLDAGNELELAVAELLAATDYPEIARWIQFPRGLMLFLVVPGDAGSGAVYVYDRCDGIWYWSISRTRTTAVTALRSWMCSWAGPLSPAR